MERKPKSNAPAHYKTPDEEAISMVAEELVAYEINAEDLLKTIHEKIHDKGYYVLRLSQDGLPIERLFDLIRIAGLTQKETEHIFDSSFRTFNLYRKEQKQLNVSDSERLLKLIDLWGNGFDTFGSYEKFNKWMRQPSYGLYGEIPLTILNAISGIDEVNKELNRIKTGDF
ncbi:DUF2384 domain-containing protein [Solitalea sp. MAHUQ-68]|uniref:DUF2384 domain-containing protein n=1 Tax=Solitalea agri TaxID=2953739 RepID=A0A9X2JD39_9SPHI|nr:antitoxin Xre/MbcA/ParS toxin-binding domain-containing protein [Solitalea agri]MCO4294127.1 DUF2384 domain-containing protein [Solitalea agri]